MALVIETALEQVFNDLLEVVLQQTIQIARFKRLLKRLENTLKSIQPVFCESRRLNKVLDRPQKETIMFIAYMEKGKELVLKCSRSNIGSVYQKLILLHIIRLNNKLLRFFRIDIDAKTMSTSMRSLALAEKKDQVLSAVTTTHEFRKYQKFILLCRVIRLSNKLLRCVRIDIDVKTMSTSMRSLALAEKKDQVLSAVTTTHEFRKKELSVEIYENKFPTWWIEGITQPIDAHTLSISTDEAFNSTWYDLYAPKVEVLTLKIRSETYALPKFIERMNQLKLNVTSYGVYPSQLQNLSLISSLSNIKRIRFEHVSVSSIQPIFELQNLQKLSFIMCEIGDALMSCDIASPYTLPSLTYLKFDQCYDLKELPSGIYNLVNLKKLSITNCHELDVLPKGLASLLNLEMLRLACCTKLEELPESIGSLRNLSFIDISDCLSISILPEEIGELCGLRVLNMTGCRGLQELPESMGNLKQLENVICDEELSYLWMDFECDLYNLKVNVVEDDRVESFMKIIH